MKIATWNIDRSHIRQRWRMPEQQRLLESHDADTIIPFHGARHTPGDRNWTAHRRSLSVQLDDWRDLRNAYPTHHMVIAGDFNMSMGNTKRLSPNYGFTVGIVLRRIKLQLNLNLARLATNDFCLLAEVIKE